MNDQIPIDENMPEDLKAAINYLNTNNISLTDTFDDEIKLKDENDVVDSDIDEVDDIDDVDDDEEEDEVAGEDADLSDISFGDGEKIDTSALDSMF